MRIHREGWFLLLFMGLGLILMQLVLWWWSAWPEVLLFGVLGLSVLFFLVLLQFFRHPRVHLLAETGVVYAPAEGKIVEMKEVEEPECLKGRCIQVSIFMSPFNVHVNRVPMAGLVEYFVYHPGKYFAAYHPKSSTANERTTLLLRGKEGHLVLVRQIAGMLARRIRYYIHTGDKVEAGQQFGFIKFGSRVDVFLPLGTKLLVKHGQRTYCAKTPLARLPEVGKTA